MIGDIVSQIKEAEDACALRRADAEAHAKDIVRQAQIKRETILAEAQKDIKEFLATERRKADQLADKQYEERIKEGKTEALKIKKSKAEQIDTATNQVVAIMLKKYGCC